VTADGAIYGEVGLHLKGSIGSFRPVDEKPALTLDFCRFQEGRKFHGLRRIHLNNSVEDPSYINEKLGSDLFRAAGIPAPRVAHAIVRLNGAGLGVYVLKEGFTEDFLSCYFRQPGPGLFEPDEGHDVDQHLKRISVAAGVPPAVEGGVSPPGPVGVTAAVRDKPAGRDACRYGLEALAEAAIEPDPNKRWTQLGAVLERDRFLTFMALEVMLGHRDGYCLARNNFRVYQNLDSGKWVFLPHGMDQLLGKAELPWRPRMAGLVAAAVLETPEGSDAYRRVFREHFSDLFKPEVLNLKIDEWVAGLEKSVRAAEFAEIKTEASLVKARLSARQAELLKQLSRPEPKLLEFADGFGELSEWTSADAPVQGEMDIPSTADGRCLRIKTRSDSAASWRTAARLGPGRYQFEGRAKIAGVKPLTYGKRQGAHLRIGGRPAPSQVAEREGTFCGDSSWRLLAAPFEITSASEDVEFICELRASAGEVWFDAGSLRVKRLP